MERMERNNMNRLFRNCLALSLLLSLAVSGLAQTPPTLDTLTQEQREEFLRTARITKKREISSGITLPSKATLTDGRTTHDAQIQTVDIRKASYKTPSGTEIDFTDSYKYNIAAYRLDKLLGLGMVPASVERKVAGDTAAVTWWVDDMLMTGKKRHKKKIPVPHVKLFNWNKQMFCLRVFDQLIYNTDRNLGNVLITKDWKIWMIDHTRAFRRHKTLRTPGDLVKCDRRLLAALRKLNYKLLERELSPYLDKGQIKALLARRDQIVEFFDTGVDKKGGHAVLYDSLPRQ